MNLLAVDPGTTTGLAWQLNSALQNPAIDSCIRPADEVLPWLVNVHNVYLFDVLIIEPFRTAGMLSKYGLQTIDLVGQLKGWAFAKGIPVVLQTPQSRKAWQKDAENFGTRKRIIHERDALMHLFQYMETNKIAYK